MRNHFTRKMRNLLIFIVVRVQSPERWNCDFSHFSAGVKSDYLQITEKWNSMERPPANAAEPVLQLFPASWNTFIELSTWLVEALLQPRFNLGSTPGVRYRRGASAWPYSVTELCWGSDLCCDAICFRSACALWENNLTMSDIQHRWKCCRITRHFLKNMEFWTNFSKRKPVSLSLQM